MLIPWHRNNYNSASVYGRHYLSVHLIPVYLKPIENPLAIRIFVIAAEGFALITHRISSPRASGHT